MMLSYVSQDALCIPPVLPKLYGKKANTLDLSFNQIQSLDGLEMFLHLTELILDNNELNDSIKFPEMLVLQTLSLNNNKLTNLEMLINQIKTKLPNLEYLSLLGNIACPNQLSDVEKDEEDYQRYRYYILHHLPKLKFLDSKVVTQEEWLEGKRKGQYMKVARPTNNYTNGIRDDDIDFQKYTPLTHVTRITRGPQGIYGKCVYRYTGLHSEGNRFIRNHEL